MMAPTQGSGGAMRSTNLKPGPITRAVVITLRDVHADKVLGASPGTYTALGSYFCAGYSPTPTLS